MKGKQPMTNNERQRLYRARQKARKAYHLSVFLPKGAKYWLDMICEREGLSKTEAVTRALRRHAKKHRRQLKIEEAERKRKEAEI